MIRGCGWGVGGMDAAFKRARDGGSDPSRSRGSFWRIIFSMLKRLK